MNPITRFLFLDALEGLARSRNSIIQDLTGMGCEIRSVGPFETFRYYDNGRLSVQLAFRPDGFLSYISIVAWIDGDEKGWDGWSKEREMKRLNLQSSWLAKVGVMTSDFAPIRISNDFSPRDGSSSITISRAEPVRGGHGAQCRE